jgi:hypothetical protein
MYLYECAFVARQIRAANLWAAAWQTALYKLDLLTHLITCIVYNE